MKKLLFVLAIGAFAACNDNTTDSEAGSADSMPTVDTNTMSTPMDTTSMSTDTTGMKSDTSMMSK